MRVSQVTRWKRPLSPSFVVIVLYSRHTLHLDMAPSTVSNVLAAMDNATPGLTSSGAMPAKWFPLQKDRSVAYVSPYGPIKYQKPTTFEEQHQLFADGPESWTFRLGCVEEQEAWKPWRATPCYQHPAYNFNCTDCSMKGKGRYNQPADATTAKFVPGRRDSAVGFSTQDHEADDMYERNRADEANVREVREELMVSEQNRRIPIGMSPWVAGGLDAADVAPDSENDEADDSDVDDSASTTTTADNGTDTGKRSSRWMCPGISADPTEHREQNKRRDITASAGADVKKAKHTESKGEEDMGLAPFPGSEGDEDWYSPLPMIGPTRADSSSDEDEDEDD